MLLRGVCKSARPLYLGIVLSVSLLVNAAAAQSPEANPYSLRFDDFEWAGEGIGVAIDGAKPLGERMPTEKSIALFERRLAEEPTDVGSLVILGELYLRLAKEQDDLPSYGKSEEVLRAALKLAPHSAPAQLNLAETLLARHNFSEALALANQVLSASPGLDQALALKFDALLESGEVEKAEAVLGQLEAQLKVPEVFVRRARLHELHGNVTAAKELLARACAGRQGDAWYFWRYGDLCLSQGDIQAAQANFQKALKIEPNDGPCLMGLAACSFAQRDWAAATDYAQQAVDLCGEPPMMAWLADLFEAQGNLGAARRWLDAAEAEMLEEAKVAGTAHARELALFLADHDRRPQEALKLAQKDLLRRHDVYAYDTLAWCAFKAGDLNLAAESIAKSLDLGTRNAGLYYHAALIYQATGKLGLSKEYRKKLSALGPPATPRIELYLRSN